MTSPSEKPTPPILLSQRAGSPWVSRMQILWHQMRKIILANFPKPRNEFFTPERYFKQLDEKYLTDAYHSLSIEGYRVSESLIEHVRSGNWDPAQDQQDKNALAARGYWQAFQSVKKSIQKVMDGRNAGEIAWLDHGDWCREMWASSVSAGILKVTDLAGYRNTPVFIRASKHVPPNVEAVRELMPAFFDLLKEEKDAAVRIVLGHFFFVYIHPYMDGNGRLGRFFNECDVRCRGISLDSITC
jgi:Fic family protein